jgi:hypothetical protein
MTMEGREEERMVRENQIILCFYHLVQYLPFQLFSITNGVHQEKPVN